MEDVYQLAVADLEMTPLDATGFWYCTKALQLAANAANKQAADRISAYCKPKYVAYHGGDDGWDVLVSDGAAQGTPPPNFASSIKPAPHK